MEGGETGSRTLDVRTATFEAANGRSMRFKTDSSAEGGRRAASTAKRAARDGARSRFGSSAEAPGPQPARRSDLSRPNT